MRLWLSDIKVSHGFFTIMEHDTVGHKNRDEIIEGCLSSIKEIFDTLNDLIAEETDEVISEKIHDAMVQIEGGADHLETLSLYLTTEDEQQ